VDWRINCLGYQVNRKSGCSTVRRVENQKSLGWRRFGAGLLVRGEAALMVKLKFANARQSEEISLDFWIQKVYRFLEVGKFVLKETTGAIWMKEEDLHLLNF